jgi:PadR family transcriptional regulator, regulatory protein PadR
MTPTPARGELPPGSLEMLILQTLTLDSLHGYAIAQHILRRSDDVLRVEQGSLYPALDRLQRKGWVVSDWRLTPTKRRARYYTITDSGREQLREELERYERIARAMSRVLGPA